MTALRVLLVEDDLDVAAGLGEYLERHGLRVDFAASAREAEHVLAGADFDVLVLDLHLPGEDGISLCRRLRHGRGAALPVLFLTACGRLDRKLDAFAAGALDYMVKPFEPAELLARLRALALRAAPSSAGTSAGMIVAAGFELDPQRHLLRRGDQHLALTALATRLLARLMQAHPGTVARDALIDALWHGDSPDSDPLRSHVHQLRKRCNERFGTPLIATVRGVGYRFDERIDGRCADG